MAGPIRVGSNERVATAATPAYGRALAVLATLFFIWGFTTGLLIMAIAGGALVVVQGWLADRFGLQNSFFLTAGCELYVMFYAVWGCKTKTAAFDEYR
jgi:fucose permease